MKRYIYIITIILLSNCVLWGQTDESERFVQVSGIITDAVYRPVSGVAVISKKLHRVSISEMSGIYSITSIPGDTIFFRALGFKRYHTIIPVNYDQWHCEVDIALEIDTITIPEVTILPWTSYNDFLKDITKEKPADPIVENMNDNLASIYVALTNQTNARISAEAGYRYAMAQNFNALAYKNQYGPNNLLNPWAWAKFIKGFKNGLLKNQKIEKPKNSKIRKKVKNPKK